MDELQIKCARAFTGLSAHFRQASLCFTFFSSFFCFVCCDQHLSKLIKCYGYFSESKKGVSLRDPADGLGENMTFTCSVFSLCKRCRTSRSAAASGCEETRSERAVTASYLVNRPYSPHPAAPAVIYEFLRPRVLVLWSVQLLRQQEHQRLLMFRKAVWGRARQKKQTKTTTTAAITQ